MPANTDQTSRTTLIARSIAITLIAAAMPLGLDISSDGDVSFGTPVAHASNEGESRGGRGNNGRGGNNGLGNGGEASQGENEGGDSDPSNPGHGSKSGGDAGDGAGGGGDGGSGGGGSGGGGEGGGGEGGGGSSGSQGSGTGSTLSAHGPSTSEASDGFSGSAESAEPDLTENEEQDLISRGWQ